MAGSGGVAGTQGFLATVANPATRLRIDRARLLMLAGLPDVADAELRFGRRTETEQPQLLALELARSMPHVPCASDHEEFQCGLSLTAF